MFDIEYSKVLDAAFDVRKHAKCALCAFHDNVRKNVGAVFLGGAFRPLHFPKLFNKVALFSPEMYHHITYSNLGRTN